MEMVPEGDNPDTVEERSLFLLIQSFQRFKIQLLFFWRRSWRSISDRVEDTDADEVH